MVTSTRGSGDPLVCLALSCRSLQLLHGRLGSAAQRVEHYEIAGYGTVRTYADSLGHEEAAKLLQQTLDEEGATDKLLTKIAETCVNQAAEQGGEEEEEGDE